MALTEPAAPTDPAGAFRGTMHALAREDWMAAAAYFDPASLAAFRRRLLERFAPAEAPPPFTVEAYLRQQPDAPRAVAEYHVAQYERHAADRATHLGRELPGVDSLEALRALGPAEAFARWLEGQSPRHEFLRMAEASGVPRAAAERQLATKVDPGASAARFEALGSLPDGDRVAHVVYRPAYRRAEGPGAPLSAGARAMLAEAEARLARLNPEEQALERDLRERRGAEVATCRRQPDGSWRLIADERFLQRSGVFFYEFEQPEDAEEEGDGSEGPGRGPGRGPGERAGGAP